MKKRGVSQVIEVMLFVLIGIIFVIGLFIFIRFEINSRGEISEIMSNLADKKVDIVSARGNFENPTKITLDLSMGAGEQTLLNYSFSQYNYTVINMTANKTLINVTIPAYWNETVEERWNETVAVYWNETIEERWNETKMVPWNETIEERWNETLAVYWNETITTTTGGSENYSTVSVADVSGSMIGNPIAELKTSTISFIDIVLNNPGNEIGLVAYSDNVLDSWSNTLSNDKTSLKSKVNLWSYSYNTCICCGVNRAIEYLKGSTKPKIMVVMSDGQANQRCVWTGYINTTYYEYAKIDAIEAARNASENYGIKVYTIGFDTSEFETRIDEATLRAMAAAGNGSYYYADLGDLEEIYGTIVEIITIEVERVNYTQVERVNYTVIERVNYTVIEHVNYTEIENTNYTLVENVNYTQVERVNYTVIERVNYTTEIQEIDAPIEVLVQNFEAQKFDHLKVIFYSDTDSYVEKIPFSELSGPLESKKLSIDLEGKIANVKKIEIYPVELTSAGKEVTGPLLAVWDVENDIV